METAQNTYKVKVEEVHSADDMVLIVDLGVDGLFKQVRARLHGVDTPSAYGLGSDTAAGKLRSEIRKLTQTYCRIQVVSAGRGSWVVVLHVADSSEKGKFINVNDMLTDRGYVFTKHREVKS